MFLGRFAVAVSGNILRMPPELVQLLAGRELRFEAVHGPDGAMVLGLPCLSPGDGEAAFGQVGPDGDLPLPPDLLRHAGIADSAVVEGRGAYLVIHR